jgi:methylmalonyl-CoA/ethylmalonyl-CoA epimerase
MKLEHVGIAVASVAEAERLYAGVLGMRVVDRETLEDRKLKVVKVQAGESVLELLEPLPGEQVISKFLATRGPGIHHLCFEVPDLRAAVADLKARGYTPLHEPRPGAGGRLVTFLKPKETLGTLIELNQPVARTTG